VGSSGIVAFKPRPKTPPARTVAPSVHPHHIADQYRGAFAAGFARAAKTLIPDMDTLTRGIGRGVTADAMSAIEDLQSFKHRLSDELTPVVQAIMAMRGREAMEKLTPVPLAKADNLQPFQISTGNFDLTNPYAIQAAQSIVGDLITQVSEETIDTVRETIAQSIENGIPPRNAAKFISSIVGLNGPQARALAKFRDGLMNAEAKLAQSRIDTLVANYGDRLLRQRGLMIARTETIRASVAGTQVAWQQAVQQGVLNAQTMGQVWIDTEDESTCPACDQLASEDPIPMGGQFSNGMDGPPDHPDCRCDVGIAELPTPLEQAPGSAFGADTADDATDLSTPEDEDEVQADV
jgi:hypothetical protein